MSDLISRRALLSRLGDFIDYDDDGEQEIDINPDLLWAIINEQPIVCDLDKLVREVGVTHSGKALSRTYRPTEESRELIANHFLDELSRFRHILTLDDLAARKQASLIH